MAAASAPAWARRTYEALRGLDNGKSTFNELRQSLEEGMKDSGNEPLLSLGAVLADAMLSGPLRQIMNESADALWVAIERGSLRFPVLVGQAVLRPAFRFALANAHPDAPTSDTHALDVPWFTEDDARGFLDAIIRVIQGSDRNKLVCSCAGIADILADCVFTLASNSCRGRAEEILLDLVGYSCSPALVRRLLAPLCPTGTLPLSGTVATAPQELAEPQRLARRRAVSFLSRAVAIHATSGALASVKREYPRSLLCIRQRGQDRQSGVTIGGKALAAALTAGGAGGDARTATGGGAGSPAMNPVSSMSAARGLTFAVNVRAEASPSHIVAAVAWFSFSCGGALWIGLRGAHLCVGTLGVHSSSRSRHAPVHAASLPEDALDPVAHVELGTAVSARRWSRVVISVSMRRRGGVAAFLAPVQREARALVDGHSIGAVSVDDLSLPKGSLTAVTLGRAPTEELAAGADGSRSPGKGGRALLVTRALDLAKQKSTRDVSPASVLPLVGFHGQLAGAAVHVGVSVSLEVLGGPDGWASLDAAGADAVGDVLRLSRGTGLAAALEAAGATHALVLATLDEQNPCVQASKHGVTNCSVAAAARAAHDWVNARWDSETARSGDETAAAAAERDLLLSDCPRGADAASADACDNADDADAEGQASPDGGSGVAALLRLTARVATITGGSAVQSAGGRVVEAMATTLAAHGAVCVAAAAAAGDAAEELESAADAELALETREPREARAFAALRDSWRVAIAGNVSLWASGDAAAAAAGAPGSSAPPRRGCAVALAGASAAARAGALPQPAAAAFLLSVGVGSAPPVGLAAACAAWARGCSAAWAARLVGTAPADRRAAPAALLAAAIRRRTTSFVEDGEQVAAALTAALPLLDGAPLAAVMRALAVRGGVARGCGGSRSRAAVAAAAGAALHRMARAPAAAAPEASAGAAVERISTQVYDTVWACCCGGLMCGGRVTGGSAAWALVRALWRSVRRESSWLRQRFLQDMLLSLAGSDEAAAAAAALLADDQLCNDIIAAPRASKAPACTPAAAAVAADDSSELDASFVSDGEDVEEFRVRRVSTVLDVDYEEEVVVDELRRKLLVACCEACVRGEYGGRAAAAALLALARGAGCDALVASLRAATPIVADAAAAAAAGARGRKLPALWWSGAVPVLAAAGAALRLARDRLPLLLIRNIAVVFRNAALPLFRGLRSAGNQQAALVVAIWYIADGVAAAVEAAARRFRAHARGGDAPDAATGRFSDESSDGADARDDACACSMLELGDLEWEDGEDSFCLASPRDAAATSAGCEVLAAATALAEAAARAGGGGDTAESMESLLRSLPAVGGGGGASPAARGTGSSSSGGGGGGGALSVGAFAEAREPPRTPPRSRSPSPSRSGASVSDSGVAAAHAALGARGWASALVFLAHAVYVGGQRGSWGAQCASVAARALAALAAATRAEAFAAPGQNAAEDPPLPSQRRRAAAAAAAMSDATSAAGTDASWAPWCATATEERFAAAAASSPAWRARLLSSAPVLAALQDMDAQRGTRVAHAARVLADAAVAAAAASEAVCLCEVTNATGDALQQHRQQRRQQPSEAAADASDSDSGFDSEDERERRRERRRRRRALAGGGGGGATSSSSASASAAAAAAAAAGRGLATPLSVSIREAAAQFRRWIATERRGRADGEAAIVRIARQAVSAGVPFPPLARSAALRRPVWRRSDVRGADGLPRLLERDFCGGRHEGRARDSGAARAPSAADRPVVPRGVRPATRRNSRGEHTSTWEAVMDDDDRDDDDEVFDDRDDRDAARAESGLDAHGIPSMLRELSRGDSTSLSTASAPGSVGSSPARAQRYRSGGGGGDAGGGSDAGGGGGDGGGDGGDGGGHARGDGAALDGGDSGAVLLSTACEHISVRWTVPATLELRARALRLVVDPAVVAERAELVAAMEVFGEAPRGKRWSVDELTEMYARRYLLQDTALELFFRGGSTCLLSFSTRSARDLVYARLVAARPQSLAARSRRAPRRQAALRSLQERWVRGELSNFAYLLGLNRIAGRSFSDVRQYPVFPWVLADYASDELDLGDRATFRDLRWPIAAQRPEQREALQDKYAESCLAAAGEFLPFHWGSHYSSPGAVSYFMLRVEPFTSLHVLLQSGKFDHGERLFRSVASSYKSACTGSGDNRELTPEMFYMPEMFVNTNAVTFPALQGGGPRINDVALPPWACGSAERFVRLHREALESEYVTANLHHWIDLIFGFRQRGKAAEEACNVFFYLTYEGAVDVGGIADPAERRANLAQIAEFGQTPAQLFTRPHPPRTARAAMRIERPRLRHFRSAKVCRPVPWGATVPSRGAAVYVRAFAERVFIVRAGGRIENSRWEPGWPDGNGQPFTASEITTAPESVPPIAYGLPWSPRLVALTPDRRMLVTCGHPDGKIVCKMVDGSIAGTVQRLGSPCGIVQCVSISPCGRFLAAGDSAGVLWLWNLSGHYVTDSPVRTPAVDTLSAHEGGVVDVALNSDHNVLVSADGAGTLRVCTLHPFGIVRTVHVDACTSITRLLITAEAHIVAAGNGSIAIVSINGRLVSQCTVADTIADLGVTDGGEVLVHAGKRGIVTARRTSNLSHQVQVEPIGSPVTSLFVSPKGEHIMTGCEDGRIAVIIDPSRMFRRLNNILIEEFGLSN